MTIDAAKEELITLTQATKLLPRIRGHKVAVSTLWRWCRKGMRGERLEYLRVGRSIVTTSEALQRFFFTLAQQDAPLEEPVYAKPHCLKPRKTISSTARQRALAEADTILAEAGI